MDILWKALVGGAVTALIAILSKRGNVLPGVLPLFPTFGMIALAIVGAKGEPGAMRETAWATIKTLPAFFAFAATAGWLSAYVDYRLAILAGLAAWGAVVALVFWR
jgi:membrane protein GlpM